MTKKETAKYRSGHRIECECDPDGTGSYLVYEALTKEKRSGVSRTLC